MTDVQKYVRKPRIVIGESDYEQLMGLASGTGRWAEAADDLLSEMERAKVVAPNKVPTEVVRMGSVVRYQPDNGPERVVTLVFPAEADISTGKISVLTPVGTALIGLKAGQSIAWEARDGRKHLLTVLAVE
jgi:regulator of nucleoside diphosphate kinase